MESLKRNRFTTLVRLQNDLGRILTHDNNISSDELRIENAQEAVANYIAGEIDFRYKTIKENKCPEEPNKCSSCEFWSAHKREGTCSQKVKLNTNKWDWQFTLEDYGCITYEPKDNNANSTI